WQARNKNNYKYLDSDEEHYKAHRFDKREAGGFFEIPEKPEDQERVMKDAGETAIKLAKEAGINYDEASGKFTNFPRVTISTNNGTAHEDVAERIQAYMSLWGIDVDVQVMEWQSFTAARRTGDYAVARQGWIADYNDPRSYLDCARSTDGNDDTQLGKDSWHASH
ncbi:MAG: ABC transporter substrate-binding protein, partial [Bacilli bacterium]|nr:ABC transporter substrate-binding protein [Bacilli bacterium]